MNVKSMTTEELEKVLRDHCNSDSPIYDDETIFSVMDELGGRMGKRSGEEAKAAWHMFLEHYLPALAEDLTDPSTGIELTPSWHGEHCLGNGDHSDIECCCDECNFYQACFPDWKPGSVWDETTRRFI